MLSTDQTLNKGRYRIINLFSHDDTGGLYEAYDTVNSSNVVLKECVNDLVNVATADQIQALDAAFAASAKVLTTIRHDSLVSVQDYFSEIGCQYLVLDGVTGLDLTKCLDPDEPRPTLSEVMAWTNKILAGLHHLHRLSPPMVHRDIRPKNIKLTSTMAVKLLTAGIGMDTTVSNMQQVSVRSGGNTARNYRPLEQLWSDSDQVAKDAIFESLDEKGRKLVSAPLDARSDLYSVGASIYHILTGTLPPDAADRASAVHEGKADPLRPPAEIDENIPAEISNAIMKSMSICREDRFDSAVIMNQVLRTAVVRTQERSPDGAEKPIQLKAIPRNSVKQEPVPEAPVFKTPVIEAPVEVSKAEAIDSPARAEEPEVETPSADVLLELETKKAENLEAERRQLEEEQKRIEARRIELEAERKRLDAEKRRLEVEAKQERDRQEKARLEKEADDERKRAAQKIAELESERQKRQAEEKRLEMLAEEEKKKAEERLKTLRTEHERIREERRRIEEAEKEELERTEKRLLELSVQPNRDSGPLLEQEVEEQLLEVDTSDPGFKTTQQIIELLEDEYLPIDPAKSKANSKDRANYYEEGEDFELHQERRSGLPLPMIAAAAAILLIAALGVWMFISSGSSGGPTPTVEINEQVPPPVDSPIVEPEQTAADTLTAANVADHENTSVTLAIDPGAANTDQRSAFTQEQERKARQAKLDAAKKPVPSASKSPKKVTVDDLINDN